MVSNSNFQWIQSSNSSNLQTFKLPNPQTLKMSNIRTPRLSNLQTFDHWKFETFNPPTLETFRTFKSWSFRTFKRSNSKLPNFRTRAWGLLCEPLRVLARSFALLLRATRVAAASNFQAGFPFKLSNSKLAPLSNSKHSNFQTSPSLFFKLFKFSNSPISSNI